MNPKLLILIFFLLHSSCTKNPVKEPEKKNPCGDEITENVSFSSYEAPLWHPNGQIIAFNHLALDSITYPNGEQCKGRYVQDFDSLGFWLINKDGSNKRRLLDSYLSADWSPDGEWLTFIWAGCVYKKQFDGHGFIEHSEERLTLAGGRYQPKWNPKGDWIAYDRSSEKPEREGLYIVRVDGSEIHKIAHRRYAACWLPSGEHLLLLTAATNTFAKISIYDTTKIDTMFTLERDISNTVRGCRFSPDGRKLAFTTQLDTMHGYKIWIIDPDGGNLTQLIEEDVHYSGISWSPDSRAIAYVKYNQEDWSYGNGTIWIVDIDTKVKRQLTFNYPK